MKNRILITGAEGFIGSHLTEILLNKKYKITALVQYNHENRIGWLNEIKQDKNLTIVSGDVKDLSFCIRLLKDIDIVFHLAALISIPYSYVSPLAFIETNVIGTYNICEAARLNKIKKLICTSTSEVYGSAIYVPIDETHPLQPQSPYSASKIGADAIAKSYFYSYKLPICIARPFNTYGPRQSNKAVIPTIITQILNKKKYINLGDLTPTRDFNYVEDTCKGFMNIAFNRSLNGSVYNIGSNKEISIYDLVKLIGNLMNKEIKIRNDKLRLRPVKSEVRRLLSDNSKIIKDLNYQPTTSLKSGLLKTIKWFSKKENLKKYNSDKYNL